MKKLFTGKFRFGLLFTLILYPFLSIDLCGAGCNQSYGSENTEKSSVHINNTPNEVEFIMRDCSYSNGSDILILDAGRFNKEEQFKFFTFHLCQHSMHKGIHFKREEFKQNDIKIDEKLRKRWIEQAINEFNKLNVLDSISVLVFKEVEFADHYQKSIRLQGKGIIIFSENSWLYLVAHSEHEDPLIGDITLGIDNRGKVYLNEGHICGGIIHFVIKNKMSTTSINDFIQHFKSDTEGAVWRKAPLKNKKKKINLQAISVNR